MPGGGPILSVEIAANLRSVIDNFTQASRAVREGAANMDASTVRAERSFSLLNNTRFSFGANFGAAATQAATATRTLATQAAAASAVLGGSVARGSNQAAFALTNLGRVAQDAPFGFIGIANNLNPLLESFQRLRQETGSNGAALRALGGSLMGVGGIGLALSAVTAIMTLSQMGLRAWTGATKDAKKATEDYVKNLEAVRSSQVMGAQSAAKELTETKLLFNAYQNANLPLKARRDAYKQLQDQYPGYFSNIKFEQNASEKTKAAYDQLTTSILASARARAAVDAITKNQGRALENEQKILDLQKDALRIKKEIDLANTRVSNSTQISKTGVDVTNEGVKAYLINEQNKNLSDQRNLATDLIRINENNLRLEKAVSSEIAKGGKITGGVGGNKTSDDKNKRLGNINIVDSVDIYKRLSESSDAGIKEFQERIKNTPIALQPQFDIPFDPVTDLLIERLSKFKDDAAELINGGISSTFAGIGTAIGDAMANGANALDAAGNALLGGFASFLSEYGKLLITYGTAAVVKGKLDVAALIPGAGIPAGIAAIAAGVLLTAAGAAIGNFASGKNKGQKTEDVKGARSISGFANGVTNFRGGTAMVGERGPEMVRLPTGSDVIPNHRLAGFGGGQAIELRGSLGFSLEDLYVNLERIGRKADRRI